MNSGNLIILGLPLLFPICIGLTNGLFIWSRQSRMNPENRIRLIGMLISCVTSLLTAIYSCLRLQSREVVRIFWRITYVNAVLLTVLEISCLFFPGTKLFTMRVIEQKLDPYDRYILSSLLRMYAYWYCVNIISAVFLSIILVTFHFRDSMNRVRRQTVNLSGEQYSPQKHESRQCPICFQVYNQGDMVYMTRCRHTFHLNCMENWVNQAATCPICRQSLF